MQWLERVGGEMQISSQLEGFGISARASISFHHFVRSTSYGGGNKTWPSYHGSIDILLLQVPHCCRGYQRNHSGSRMANPVSDGVPLEFLDLSVTASGKLKRNDLSSSYHRYAQGLGSRVSQEDAMRRWHEEQYQQNLYSRQSRKRSRHQRSRHSTKQSSRHASRHAPRKHSRSNSNRRAHSRSKAISAAIHKAKAASSASSKSPKRLTPMERCNNPSRSRSPGDRANLQSPLGERPGTSAQSHRSHGRGEGGGGHRRGGIGSPSGSPSGSSPGHSPSGSPVSSRGYSPPLSSPSAAAGLGPIVAGSSSSRGHMRRRRRRSRDRGRSPLVSPYRNTATPGGTADGMQSRSSLRSNRSSGMLSASSYKSMASSYSSLGPLESLVSPTAAAAAAAAAILKEDAMSTKVGAQFASVFSTFQRKLRNHGAKGNVMDRLTAEPMHHVLDKADHRRAMNRHRRMHRRGSSSHKQSQDQSQGVVRNNGLGDHSDTSGRDRGGMKTKQLRSSQSDQTLLDRQALQRQEPKQQQQVIRRRIHVKTPQLIGTMANAGHRRAIGQAHTIQNHRRGPLQVRTRRHAADTPPTPLLLSAQDPWRVKEASTTEAMKYKTIQHGVTTSPIKYARMATQRSHHPRHHDVIREDLRAEMSRDLRDMVRCAKGKSISEEDEEEEMEDHAATSMGSHVPPPILTHMEGMAGDNADSNSSRPDTRNAFMKEMTLKQHIKREECVLNAARKAQRLMEERSNHGKFLNALGYVRSLQAREEYTKEEQHRAEIAAAIHYHNLGLHSPQTMSSTSQKAKDSSVDKKEEEEEDKTRRIPRASPPSVSTAKLSKAVSSTSPPKNTALNDHVLRNPIKFAASFEPRPPTFDRSGDYNTIGHSVQRSERCYSEMRSGKSRPRFAPIPGKKPAGRRESYFGGVHAPYPGSILHDLRTSPNRTSSSFYKPPTSPGGSAGSSPVSTTPLSKSKSKVRKESSPAATKDFDSEVDVDNTGDAVDGTTTSAGVDVPSNGSTSSINSKKEDVASISPTSKRNSSRRRGHKGMLVEMDGYAYDYDDDDAHTDTSSFLIFNPHNRNRFPNEQIVRQRREAREYEAKLAQHCELTSGRVIWGPEGEWIRNAMEKAPELTQDEFIDWFEEKQEEALKLQRRTKLLRARLKNAKLAISCFKQYGAQ